MIYGFKGVYAVSIFIFYRVSIEVSGQNQNTQLLFIMPLGVVKFFNETKGFGFIMDAEDESKEYFVHATGLIDKVDKEDKVEYDLVEGRKGLNATNVKLVKE